MIDLKNDFKILLKEELDNNKIIYKDKNDLIEFLIMYYDAINRIPVIGKKYNVIYSKELQNKISSLPQETRLCVKDIDNRLRQGESITTYLSNLVLDASTRDNELQNWNIYHAHVMKISQDYDRPAKRSDLLLFFSIKDQDIYFLDVKKHPKGSKWFDRELIEIIYNNWSNMLNVIEGATGLSPEMPDNMVHNMSQTLGVLITINGKIVMPTTFGNTSAGNSVNSTMWAQGWIKKLNSIEKDLNSRLDIIKSEIEKECGEDIKKPLDIHLVNTIDGDLKLYESNYNKYI